MRPSFYFYFWWLVCYATSLPTLDTVARSINPAGGDSGGDGIIEESDSKLETGVLPDPRDVETSKWSQDFLSRNKKGDEAPDAKDGGNKLRSVGPGESDGVTAGMTTQVSSPILHSPSKSICIETSLTLLNTDTAGPSDFDCSGKTKRTLLGKMKPPTKHDPQDSIVDWPTYKYSAPPDSETDPSSWSRALEARYVLGHDSIQKIYASERRALDANTIKPGSRRSLDPELGIKKRALDPDAPVSGSKTRALHPDLREPGNRRGLGPDLKETSGQRRTIDPDHPDPGNRRRTMEPTPGDPGSRRALHLTPVDPGNRRALDPIPVDPGNKRRTMDPTPVDPGSKRRAKDPNPDPPGGIVGPGSRRRAKEPTPTPPDGIVDPGSRGRAKDPTPTPPDGIVDPGNGRRAKDPNPGPPDGIVDPGNGRRAMEPTLSQPDGIVDPGSRRRAKDPDPGPPAGIVASLVPEEHV
ncbi:hypothetical protein B0O99DRAFT_602856 [Bisporella sp. PMI_857]|nr:hypothetical protein B0O99DRAFT_602856 [Bisporella sp. PMI_857]